MGSTLPLLPPALLAAFVAAGVVACGDAGSPAAPPDGEPEGDPPATFDEEGTWTELAPLPHAVSWPAPAAFRGRIYAAGGSVDDDVPTARVYRYDPDADTWSEHSRLPDPRDEHGAVSVGDRLLVLGGGGGLRPLPDSSLAVYEPGRGWRRGAPPPRGTGSQTASGVAADTLFTLRSVSSSARLDAFDPGTGAWLDNRGSPLPPQTHAGTAWRGRLHVVAYTGADRIHHAYDPASAEWISLPPMPAAVRHTRPVALADHLYVVGGLNRDQVRSAEAWRFGQP